MIDDIYKNFPSITNNFQYNAFLKQFNKNQSYEIIIRLHAYYSLIKEPLDRLKTFYFFNNALKECCDLKDEKIKDYLTFSLSHFSRSVVECYLDDYKNDSFLSFFKHNPGAIDLIIDKMDDVGDYDFLCNLLNIISTVCEDSFKINKANRVFDKAVKYTN